MPLKSKIFLDFHYNAKFIIYFKNSHLKKTLNTLLLHEIDKYNKVFCLQIFSEDITSTFVSN